MKTKRILIICLIAIIILCVITILFLYNKIAKENTNIWSNVVYGTIKSYESDNVVVIKDFDLNWYYRIAITDNTQYNDDYSRQIIENKVVGSDISVYYEYTRLNRNDAVFHALIVSVFEKEE